MIINFEIIDVVDTYYRLSGYFCRVLSLFDHNKHNLMMINDIYQMTHNIPEQNWIDCIGLIKINHIVCAHGYC